MRFMFQRTWSTSTGGFEWENSDKMWQENKTKLKERRIDNFLHYIRFKTMNPASAGKMVKWKEQLLLLNQFFFRIL